MMEGVIMKLPRRQFLHLAAGAAALSGMSRIARAQAYPTRPITIVVPFPPGGGSDNTARVVAEGMRAVLGQPVVIENVGGVGGVIGVGRAARAAPDGYTLSFGYVGTHVFNGAVYALQFDVLKDFEPISLITGGNPWMIVAKNALPAKDLKEWIAWSRANPDKGLVAVAGVGGPGHILGAFLQSQTGTRFQFVPYRGGGPGLQDLVAGHVDILIETPATVLPQVRAGSIRALAVTAKTHYWAAPDIPTVDEMGAPGVYFTSWTGIWAPKGTPKNIITTLNAAVVDALADAVVRSRLAEFGLEIFPRDQQTPEALGALQKAEIEKWWPIIKEAGIRAE
jgi:tripartite-type tricarboxylate transporter receptor subunit TctC